MNVFNIEEGLAGESAQLKQFDLIVIGGGAAGLTLVRELSGRGLKIALVESGGLEETEQHESLNDVEVSGDLLDPLLQKARLDFHGPQLKLWSNDIQKFGVRCRVLGGSTQGWAGKVAPFDQMDFEARSWIENSGWPLSGEDLLPYLNRAAEHLDLGPLIFDGDFWSLANVREPEQIGRLQFFHSFFWQFARSRSHLTDVMRFGTDFKNFYDEDVSLFLNATVTSIHISDACVSGVSLISSLTGLKTHSIRAPHVVLAAGAIENARLLLLSKRNHGSSLGDDHEVIGRYLTDHLSVQIGSFRPEHRDVAGKILGFFPFQKNIRVYLYTHGLALLPEHQRRLKLPNMAIFTLPELSEKDPLVALKRLGHRDSKHIFRDAWIILRNLPVVLTTTGRKLINYRKVPLRLRRLIADLVIKFDANFVARDYQSGGRGRKINALTVRLISEQLPQANNRIELSEHCDRLGIPLARVHWSSDEDFNRSVKKVARLLDQDFSAAGLQGFELAPEMAEDYTQRLPIHDMAHTAGTTRMGVDHKTSVVDLNCQMHRVSGLYLAGASVFPTSGHANPTLMILGLAIRLADHLKPRIVKSRLDRVSRGVDRTELKPLILVTGGTGNIGTELVARLIAKGFRVRSTFRHRLPQIAGVDWVAVNFADPDLSQRQLSELLSGVDGIINLAASLSVVEEMQTTNVDNLRRLAETAEAAGVRYFCQASSIVVYGSPRGKCVDETSPVIDLNAPVEKQYFVEDYMRHYARTKLIGENILREFGTTMRVDICRIAVAQRSGFLNNSFQWSWLKRVISLYRNSHFIATQDVARALLFLTERGLSARELGIETYNVSDVKSPTYADHYRASGRSTGFYLPVVFDLLKGFAKSRTFQFRRPLGWFRVNGAKLEATGFALRDPDVAASARSTADQRS